MSFVEVTDDMGSEEGNNCTATHLYSHHVNARRGARSGGPLEAILRAHMSVIYA